MSSLSLKFPSLWDLLHSIEMELSLRAWMEALQSLCLNSFLRHCCTVEENVDLENSSGLDTQCGNGASSCSVVNRRQKLASIDECHRTPSGAEKSIKELAHAIVFLHIRRNREGKSQCLPNSVGAHLRKIRIREAHKNSPLQWLLTCACLGPHLVRNFCCKNRVWIHYSS